MIKLLQGEINTSIFTLNENLTGATQPTDFYFHITQDTTLQEKNFYATDLSTNTERYNKFNIELTNLANQDLLNSKLYLEDNGFYSYYVYASSGATENLLETGRFLVLPSGSTVTTYYSGGTKNTFY